ncbi:hypothetical protein [Streptomyces sp. NPDC020681]|uniref:hypothetical protein n=1 Tax=Streptomyces sp. NPDC020681 TaxID=3365083 RepID=UPI0037B88369
MSVATEAHGSGHGAGADLGTAAGFAGPAVAGTGRPGPGTVQLVTRVLTALVAETGPQRHAPIVLAATDHCLRAVAEFVAKCEDSTRRLRPSVSLALEPSLLLGRFTVEQDWAAPCYALVTPGGAGASALRWATAAVGSGTAPAVVVCEVVHAQQADGERVVALAALIGPGGSAATEVRTIDDDVLEDGLDSALRRAALGGVEEGT